MADDTLSATSTVPAQVLAVTGGDDVSVSLSQFSVAPPPLVTMIPSVAALVETPTTPLSPPNKAWGLLTSKEIGDDIDKGKEEESDSERSEGDSDSEVDKLLEKKDNLSDHDDSGSESDGETGSDEHESDASSKAEEERKLEDVVMDSLLKYRLGQRIRLLWIPNLGVGLSLYINMSMLLTICAFLLLVPSGLIMYSFAHRCERDLEYLLLSTTEGGYMRWGNATELQGWVNQPKDYISQRDKAYAMYMDGYLTNPSRLPWNYRNFQHHIFGWVRCVNFAYDFRPVNGWLELLMIFFFVCLMFYLAVFLPFIQRYVARLSMRRNLSVADYSVLITNLHHKTTAEQIFLLLVKKCKLRVAKLTLLPSSRYIWAHGFKREKILRRRRKPWWWCYLNSWGYCLRRQKKKIERAEDGPGTWQRSFAAIVTFSHLEDTVRCLQKFRIKNRHRPMAHFPQVLLPQPFPPSRKLRHHLLIVDPAPYPPDVVWENLRFPEWKRKIVRIANSILAVFLVLSGIWISWSGNLLGFLTRLGFIIGPIIALHELVIRRVLLFFANLAHYPSRTEVQVRLVRRVVFVRTAFFVAAFLISSKGGVPGITDLFATNAVMAMIYYLEMGYSFTSSLVVAILTAPPVLPLLAYPFHVIKNRGFLDGLHKSEFDLATGYAYLVSKFLLLMFFLPVFPICGPLLFIAMFMHLLMERVNILLFYKKPVVCVNSARMDKHVRWIFRIAVWFFVFSTGFLYVMRRLLYRRITKLEDYSALGWAWMLLFFALTWLVWGCRCECLWCGLRALFPKQRSDRVQLLKKLVKKSKKRGKKGKSRLHYRDSLGDYDLPFEDVARVKTRVFLMSHKRRKRFRKLSTVTTEYDSTGQKVTPLTAENLEGMKGVVDGVRDPVDDVDSEENDVAVDDGEEGDSSKWEDVENGDEWTASDLSSDDSGDSGLEDETFDKDTSYLDTKLQPGSIFKVKKGRTIWGIEVEQLMVDQPRVHAERRVRKMTLRQMAKWRKKNKKELKKQRKLEQKLLENEAEVVELKEGDLVGFERNEDEDHVILHEGDDVDGSVDDDSDVNESDSDDDDSDSDNDNDDDEGDEAEE